MSSAQSAAPATTFVVTPDQAEDLLFELESTAFTGRLCVDTESEKGEVVFREGSILEARFEAQEGRQAILCMLTAARGKWTLQPCAIDEGSPIAASVNSILIRDESRQLHWHELCAHAPPMGSVLRLSSAGERVRDTSSGYQTSLLNLIDGRRALMQVLEDSPSDPVDTLEQLLDAFEHSLVQLTPARNSLFPLSATDASSGFMPRLAPTSGGSAASALRPEAAAADLQWQSMSKDARSLAAPIANSNAARDEPLSEPFPAHTRHCIGRYEVLMRIGSGGMGTVYLSRVQSEQTGFRRLFALKLLRSHLSGDVQATREFLDEARVAGILHHANVVGVSDAGFHRQRPYLVMDYVEGCSLKQLMSGGPGRSPFLVLPIVLDALAGLHAVHTLSDDSGVELRLVHCDISPENMLVGVDGTCRLTDFGVTRRASYTHGTSTRGKLGYVAPEQISARAFDHRVDIFSMGVVLWNCLTGKSLFAANTVEETLANVCGMDIVPPSKLGAESSAELDQVIMRALSREPNARFDSAEDMLTNLREVAVAGSGLATNRDIATWVREAAGRELALRRLSVLDASRSAASVPREFPSTRLLFTGDSLTDNFPIPLTRVSSKPPRLDEESHPSPDTKPITRETSGIELAETTIVSTAPEPPEQSVGDLFYSMDDLLSLDPEWIGSSSKSQPASAHPRRNRGVPFAYRAALIVLAMVVASLIGYALTDVLASQPLLAPATQPVTSK